MQLGSINQMINSTHEAPSQNGLQIGTQVICTTALLDSGATMCFMDVLFGHTHSIPKVVKTKPIPVKVINRQPLLSGAIIEETIPLELIMESHREMITFDLISSPRHPRVSLVSDAQSHCGSA